MKSFQKSMFGIGNNIPKGYTYIEAVNNFSIYFLSLLPSSSLREISRYICSLGKHNLSSLQVSCPKNPKKKTDTRTSKPIATKQNALFVAYFLIKKILT